MRAYRKDIMKFLVTRLREFQRDDPWDVGFSYELVSEELVDHPLYRGAHQRSWVDGTCDYDDPMWHACRVLWLSKHTEDLECPIDVVVMEFPDGTPPLTVPLAPFERWALHVFKPSHEEDADAWKNVCRSGLKMGGDNPDHSDWVIGAGLDISEAYRAPYRETSYEYASKIVDRHRGYTIAHSAFVIRDDGPKVGVVGEDIHVIPHLGPEYIEALNGTAIITEAGGQLAHLAVVSLGKPITIVRVANAVATFPKGARVVINTNPGTAKRMRPKEDDE